MFGSHERLYTSRINVTVYMPGYKHNQGIQLWFLRNSFLIERQWVRT